LIDEIGAMIPDPTGIMAQSEGTQWITGDKKIVLSEKKSGN
jgi:hypothetical protein